MKLLSLALFSMLVGVTVSVTSHTPFLPLSHEQTAGYEAPSDETPSDPADAGKLLMAGNETQSDPADAAVFL